MPRLSAFLICFALLAPLAASAGTFVAQPSYATEQRPATLLLDASRAGDGIMRVHERVPADGRALTLVYPKWIPGEHGPTGPLNDLAALSISANGTALDWRRDPVDLYAFHVNLPAGADAVDVDFDVLMNAPGDVMSTHSLAVLNWNRALLYQLASLFRQACDRAALRLGLRVRVARSGAQRQSHRLRRHWAERAGRFAARHGALREEVGSVA
jgi:hypothetical protein